MKPHFAALCLIALSGQVLAETPAGTFRTCTDQGSALDTTEECKALRASYLAVIETCMADPPVSSTAGIKLAPSGSNHAYSARYLICVRMANSLRGPFGD